MVLFTVSPLRKYIVATAAIFTIVTIVSLIGRVNKINQSVFDIAQIQANSVFENADQLRRWNSRHGGVYVLENDSLKQTTHEGFKAKNGLRLTRVDHAMMMQEVNRQTEGFAGQEISRHVVGLHPKRSSYVPDEWEKKSLQSIIRGEDKYEVVRLLNGEQQLRLMKPFLVEQSCLNCHDSRTFTVGEISGGLSVSVPIKPIRSVQNSTIADVVVTHGLVWMFAMIGFILTGNVLRKNQLRLKESEQRYRTLINDNEAVMLIVNPVDLRIVEVNRAALKFYGYTNEQFLSLKVSDINTLSEEEIAAEMKKTIAGEKNFFNFKHRLCSGEIRFVQVFTSSIVLNGQQFIHTLIFDVSAQKEWEYKLHESEERYKTIVQTSRDFIHIIDEQGNLIQANDAFLRHLEYTDQDVPFLNVKQWDAQWDETELAEVRTKLYERGATFETVHKTRSGKRIPVEISAESMTLNKKIYLYCNARDITDRNKLQKNLEDSVSLYESLVNSLPFNLYRVDVNGRITFINKELADRVGLGNRAVSGIKAEDFYPDDVVKKFEINNAQVITSGEILRIREKSINPSTHQQGHVDVILIPIKNESGVVIGVQGVFWDITENVKAVEQLHLLSSALKSAANGVVITNHEGIIEWVNPAFEELTGFSLDEGRGKNPKELIKSGKHNAAFYKGMWETIRSGKVWTGELINKKKNGTFYYEEQTITPVIDDEGNITHYIGIKQDISESKKNVRAIQKKQREMQGLALSVFELIRMTAQPLSDAISEAFRILGEQLQSVDLFLYESTMDESTGADMLMCKYAWSRESGSNSLTAVEKILPRWAPVLKTGGTITVLRHQLPLEHQALFEETDVQRISIVPIIFKGEFRGCMGLTDTKQEEWETDEELVLKIAATSFGNAIERRRVEKKLLTNEQLYRTVFEKSSVGMSRVKLNGDLIEVNQKLCDITGYSREELCRLNFKDITFAEDIATSLHTLRQLTSGEIHDCIIEKRYVRKDGEIVWVNVSISSVVDEEGEPQFMIGSVNDISQRKAAEASIVDSEKLLRESQVAAQIGSYSLDISTGMWRSSSVLDSIFGIDSLFARNIEGWISVIHPEWQDVMDTYFREEVLGKKKRFDLHYMIIRRSTHEARWVHGEGELDFDGTGNPVRMYGTIRDITLQKEIEKALRESEERYQGLIQSAIDGYCVLTTDGKLLQANDAYSSITGYSKDELLSMSIDVLDANEDRQMVDYHIRRVLQQGYDKYETRQRCKNGSLIDVFVNITSLPSQNVILCFVSDITSRKQSELKLQESEKRFRSILENISAVAIMVDRDGTITLCNDYLVGLSGYEREEIIGKNVFDLFIRNGEKKIVRENVFDPAVAGGDFPRYYENPIVTKSGARRMIAWSNTLMTDEFKNIIGITSIGQDITEKYEAEILLKESERKYRSLVQTMQQGLAVHEIICDDNGQPVDYRFIEMNESYEMITGLRRRDIVGKTVLEVMPKTEQYWIDTFGRVAITGEPVHYENFAQELNRFYSVDVYQPEPMRFAVIVSDITQLRDSELALRKSEQLYRMIAENTTDVIWTMDLNGKFTYVSPSVQQMRGFTVEEVMQQRLEDAICQTSLPAVMEKFNHLQIDMRYGRKTDDAHMEIEQPRKDGSTVWTGIVARVMYEENGSPVGILGVSRNIEEARKIRMALKASEEKYRLLVENGTESIFVVQDGIILFANAMAEKKIGLADGKLIGTSAFRYMPREERQRVMTAYRNLIEGRVDSDLQEYIVLGNNGEEIWAEVNSVRITWEGKPAALNFAIDITERKRAERMLRQSEETYRNLINSINEMIYIQDENAVFLDVNRMVEKMYGYDREFLIGKTPDIISAEEKNSALDFPSVFRRAWNGTPQLFEFYARRKDGSVFPKEVSLTVGLYFGKKVIIAVARDIHEQKLSQDVLLTRYRLSEFAISHTLPELLRMTLDETERITGSTIGFFHFVENDQLTISLQEWSTKTKSSMCSLDPEERHYPVSAAGIWADCVRDKQPKIHNDYPNHPNRKGLPSGHAQVYREAVVPIIRNEKVVAILGVGNKVTDYSQEDVEIIFQLASLAWDIVLRKKAEDDYNESEQRWKYALEGSGDGVWEWDVKKKIVYRSHQWKAMLGYSDSEIEDTYEAWKNLVHPDDIHRVTQQSIASDQERNDTNSVEYRIRCKDGSYKWILDRGKIMEWDTAGEPVRVIGTHTDIDELKRIQEQIRQLNENLEVKIEERTVELQDANKQLESFAYSVSHDLRAPLRAIDSFSRILMDEEIEHLSTEGKRQLSTIRMNTVRMSRLIDDLLEFSRLSRSELQKIHFNMEVVVKTIAREAINAEPLRSFELSIHPMPKAFGDPSLMRQVLSNLIGNAVKFTKNCAVAKIEIGGIESEHDISYYVKDNGAGFDMKYADKLFGVFQRLHTLSEFEGTGVGLAIVHRIIHRHGGTIQPFGEVGNGAIFTFTIPKQQIKLN